MLLFEPHKIGQMELKNRIIMPPMGTHYPHKDGAVSKKLIFYHVRRAKGEVALNIVEGTAVDSTGDGIFNELGIWDDRHIEGLSLLTSQIKANGAKAAIQLYHPGRQASSKRTGVQPIGPSPVPYHIFGRFVEVPRELSIQEIEKLAGLFAKGAERAKKAGFDAAEIHGAHGYLICSFLSPFSNNRTDEYGGSIEKRAKFAIEIINAIREKVGKNFPLIFRLSGNEFIEGGLTLEQTKEIAVLLEESGVDAISVSSGNHNSFRWFIPPMFMPEGCLVPLAEGIRKVVNIPVIAVGRIHDCEFAERILKEGKADFIAMGRALLADPDLPKKAREGRFGDIKRCISCNSCIDRMMINQDVRCMVNYETGIEDEIESIERTNMPKRVMVIGGGPGGMEAARVLSQRGHEVTLCDKEERLGGSFNLAILPPGKEDFRYLIDDLSRQIKNSRITVYLEREVTPELIDEEKPEVVIMATGAIPIVPDVPGITLKNVALAQDVLSEKDDAGDRVVIVGGGLVGCETAHFLAKKGKNVTIVEMLERVGADMGRTMRWVLLEILKEENIRILTQAKCEEIKQNGIMITRNSESEFLEADTIVIAVGYQPDSKLYNSIKGRVSDIFLIGDCKEARKAFDAIHEGSSIAYQI